ncbi:MAG TPA: class I SAM-dependent methyltransferase [Jatrophihabitantaceae bacterium]
MGRLYDDSLYEGAAAHYLAGRMPYPARLLTAFDENLPRNARGRLLDLGCGPGTLTLLLAPLFAEVLAVDADAGMLRVAQAAADRCGIANVTWRCAAAEDVDVADGSVDVVTLAQSFHWMNRPVVAANVRRWLVPGGWCVHVGATTHAGEADAPDLPHPAPPHEQIDALVRRYLGPRRRAGQQFASEKSMNDEEDMYRGAGLVGPHDVQVAGGDVHVRTADQVVSAVLSLSSSAPHLFGARLAGFERDLRDLLRDASPDGLFAEQLQSIRLSLWRSPGST